jgi:subtilisin family serine protease
MRIRIEAGRLRATATRAAATMAAMAAVCSLPGLMADAAAQVGPSLRSAAPVGPVAVPGEIVVGYRSGVEGSERAAARSAADVRAARNLLAPRAQLVKVESGQTVPDAITALEKRADVRYAEPNWIYQASSTTPDDPLFGGLWGLSNTGQAVNGQAGTADVDIDAPEAWDVNRGSASTVVAVVDTGVAFEHPDLAPNMWSNPGETAGNGVDDEGNGMVDDTRGWDFVGDDNNPWDYTDHGTHVAGTIAARGNNGIGVAGVAWQASIMDVRALNASGSGSNADIVDAFTYAAANGAKVVNASLGGPAFSQAMSDAITEHPDSLFVVAAGNAAQNNDSTPAYPCSYTAANLICVAATDNTDALAGFSNYGVTAVDLAAPGVGIDSARPHYLPDDFNDDFESALGKWTVQSGPWGTSTQLNTTWLTDSPGASYANNADWAIRTSSKVDLADRTDCVLKFRYGTFLQAGDWLDVQSSIDGTAWTDLGRIGHTNGAVRSAGIELGAAGSRYYRYRLTSNASGTTGGVYIDNVRIACPGGLYGSEDYQLLDGTSMASPHVAGAAAVLFSHKPSAAVADVKAALVDTGDPIAALSEKTVSGRRLNLNAALASPAIMADTTTVINSVDPDPSVVGDAVTVHYSVKSEALGGATPTGNVTVSDGVDSCTATVAAAECDITLTTPGARSLTATYAGDSNFSASTSAAEPHTVNRLAPTPPPPAEQPPAEQQLPAAQQPASQPPAGPPAASVAPSRPGCAQAGNLIVGTPGDDRRGGSALTDIMLGRRGADILHGLGGADCLYGHKGADRLFGGPGRDRLFGGPGPDRVSGGAHDDLIDSGPGRDRITAGAGNDRVLARGHAADTIDCGPGARDVAIVDDADRTRRCEQVRRP